MIESSKTRGQFCNEYQVSTKTFKKWLKESLIDLPTGLIYPHKQKEIYEKLGEPPPKPENKDIKK